MPVPSVRSLLAAMAVALAAMVGCSSNDGAVTTEPTGDATYALLRTDEWTLQEAVDPPADDPIATADRPPLAWYAE